MLVYSHVMHVDIPIKLRCNKMVRYIDWYKIEPKFTVN